MADPINIRGKNEVEWKHSINHRVDLKDQFQEVSFPTPIPPPHGYYSSGNDDVSSIFLSAVFFKEFCDVAKVNSF
jgi:hypothetical protein